MSEPRLMGVSGSGAAGTDAYRLLSLLVIALMVVPASASGTSSDGMPFANDGGDEPLATIEVLTSAPLSTWGNGSNGMDDAFNTWYHDSRSQAVYLASELTAAGMTPGTITSIQLYCFQVHGNSNLKNFRIRMKLTSATTSSAWVTSGWTLVYGPTDVINTAGIWMTFTLGTTFNWDGTGNLLLDLTRDDSYYTSGGGMYVRSGLSSSRTFGGHSDSGYTWPFDGMGGTSFTHVPALKVIYTPAPIAPYAPTLSKPFDSEKGGEWAFSLRPEFVFTTTDPNGDRIQYNVQVDDDPAFATPNIDAVSGVSAGFTDMTNGAETDPYPSGDVIKYAAQSNLTPGTYYWRVRAKDPGGTNTYSSFSARWSLTLQSGLFDPSWYQTAKAQFDQDVVKGDAFTSSYNGGAVEVAGGSGQRYISGAGNPQRQPFDMYYYYHCDGAIYLASEIGPAGTITKLAWERTSADATPPWIYGSTIYIHHTALSNWSITPTCAELQTGALVWSGTLDPTQLPSSGTGWGYPYLTLATPFAYNGVDNIIVSFRHQAGTSEGSYSCGSDTNCWSASTQSTYRFASGSDSYNPPNLNPYLDRPNVRFDVDVAFGSATNNGIKYSDGPSVKYGWDRAVWNESETGGGSATVAAQRNGMSDCSGAWSWATATSMTSPLNLKSLGNAACIRVVSNLTASAGQSAKLLDWEVTWNKNPTYPTAPTGLSLSSANRKLTLSWGAPGFDGGQPITKYRVYRSTVSGSERFLVMTSGSTFTFANTGLTNGVRYYYQVSAINSVGEGPRSGEASGIPSKVPGAPRRLVAASGILNITLSWLHPLHNGGSPVLNYSIYRGFVPGGEFYYVGTGNTFYVDYNVAGGTIYYYKVTAWNSAGEGPASVEVSVKGIERPGVPLDVEVIEGINKNTISWTQPSYIGGSNITSYKIYRGTSSGEGFLVSVSASSNSYNDIGVIPGTVYYYRVSAVNVAGEGQKSSAFWTQMNPSTRPSSRYGHAMVYNSVRDRVILFGGYAPYSGGFNDETWSYDYNTNTWFNMYPGSRPSYRRSHAMVYDPRDDRVVLFGGYDGGYYYGGTWIYDYYNNSWYQSYPAMAPSPRESPAMAYDSVNDRVILFGGWANDGRNDETWAFDYRNNTWTNMSPANHPSARYAHAMAYDAVNGGVAMFGGWTGQYSDETWIYRYSTNEWMNVTMLTPHPSGRYDHSMAYDPDDHRILVFGGYTASGDTDQTWAFDCNLYQWINLGVTVAPYPRDDQAMAYDIESDRLIMFGGYYNWDDTWAGNEDVFGVPYTFPTAPRNLVATSGDNRITLSWNPPLSNGGSTIVFHKIYRGTSSGTETYYADASRLDSSFVDTSVVGGVTYYYTVKAVNAAGESPASNEVFATVRGSPSAPLTLIAIPGSRKVTLTWTPPLSDGGSPITSYQIWRGTSPGGETFLVSVSGSAISATDWWPTPGVMYYYKIRAVNAMGPGPFSNEASSIASSSMPPSPPGNDPGIPGIGIVALVMISVILVVMLSRNVPTIRRRAVKA